MKESELDVESEWVLRAISHEIRQKMLYLINENTTQSYTELMQKIDLSTGKLNFHLKQLTGLIEKNTDGTYKLTIIGKKALDILGQIDSIGEDKEQAALLKSIVLSKSRKQIQPAPETKKKWYLWIGIIYGLFIWLPIVILESIFDFQFLNILSSQKAPRITVYILLITGILLVLAILSCVLAKLYVERIDYEILDTEITIRKGLLVKTRAVIPFRTITNLVVKQGPLDIIFGISNVIIQTAGESAKGEPEGLLIGIYYAQDLIEEILNLVRLLDPPSFLKEKIPSTTTSKNISTLYSHILNELQNIKQKLTDESKQDEVNR